MTAADDTGLGLFDDAASAAGNFPTALRGYDRAAVDDYVRSLEAAMVKARQQVASLESELTAAGSQLGEARHAVSEIDYSGLGGRASDILRLAEEQAKEVMEQATVDAERLKELAHRDADSTREQAVRDSDELKSGGIADLDRMRNQLAEDVDNQLGAARTESSALIAAARREGEALLREAEHEAQVVRQTAYLDTEELRRAVERQVAETRQLVAEERESAIAELRRIHEEAVEQTSAALAEAREHARQSTERLEADLAEAARIKADALAEAEQLKLASVKEADDRVSVARQQAATINERTRKEFTWRKQQLRRETELLSQRKAAVLDQLTSLSELAQRTASSFPDIDDLDFATESDQTILRPVGVAPTAPERGGGDNGSGGSAPDHGGQSAASFDEDDFAVEDEVDRTVDPVGPVHSEHEPDGAATTKQLPVAGSESDQTVQVDLPSDGGTEHGQAAETADTRPAPAAEEDDVPVDGDATIMVPPGQLPAGARQLRRDEES